MDIDLFSLDAEGFGDANAQRDLFSSLFISIVLTEACSQTVRRAPVVLFGIKLFVSY